MRKIPRYHVMEFPSEPMEQIDDKSKDILEESNRNLNMSAVSNDEESEVEESFWEKMVFRSLLRTSRQERFHDREYGLVFNLFGFLLGCFLVLFADVSDPKPELCPSIKQFWMFVQGWFFIIFHVIAFFANVVGKEDNITTVQEVVCSLFGLYLWIGFITQLVSWVSTFFST